jgi:hypothetical protein
MGKRSRAAKTSPKANKVMSTSSLADLKTIIAVEKLTGTKIELESVIPEVVTPKINDVVVPVVPIVEVIAPTTNLTVEKTIPFKVPQKAEKQTTRTGVISGIQRSEPHNDINMLKIGTIINGAPMIYTAQRKNFDTSVPFKVNDQVEFVLQKFFSKGEERFNADKVKLITTGVPIMDEIIANMQKSPTIIAYSENQLRVLITEYAKTATTIEDAIKAIETETKLKFRGKTDIKYPMFAFEKC